MVRVGRIDELMHHNNGSTTGRIKQISGEGGNQEYYFDLPTDQVNFRLYDHVTFDPAGVTGINQGGEHLKAIEIHIK